MAKRPTDFAQQNTERAFEVTSYSLNWMREMAERNLNQSKAALEDLLTITRKAVDDMDHQAAVIREHSISVMEETLSNSKRREETSDRRGAVEGEGVSAADSFCSSSINNF